MKIEQRIEVDGWDANALIYTIWNIAWRGGMAGAV